MYLKRLRKTAVLEKKPRYTRESTHSGSHDYAASTSSSMKSPTMNWSV